MAWEKTGTITLVQGNAVVNGANTQFVDAKVSAGMCLRTADGLSYEIASVVSNTQLVLATAILGASGAGQAYAIIPTQANIFADLAASFRGFKDTYGAYTVTSLVGRFAPGSTATPGIAFTTDYGSGITQVGASTCAIIAGGVTNLIARSSGVMECPGDLYMTNTARGLALNNLSLFSSATPLTINYSASTSLVFKAGDNEAARLTPSGNLLVGINGNDHTTIMRNVGEGNNLLSLLGGGQNPSAVFIHGQGPLGNGSGSVLRIGTHSVSGASIRAGGTINASGADFAERMRKARVEDTIRKGDVCGVDVNGQLTVVFSEAHSFVIKSTDPAYIGGDRWDRDVGEEPKSPGDAPPPPTAPVRPEPLGSMPVMPQRSLGEDDESFQTKLLAYANELIAAQQRLAAWNAFDLAMAEHDTAVAQFQAARAAHDAARVRYEADLEDWRSRMEAARQWIDVIAFTGQVPVRVRGDFAPGDYVVAVEAADGGIEAIAVSKADIRPGGNMQHLYLDRIGKIWAVTKETELWPAGLAWVDVQHG